MLSYQSFMACNHLLNKDLNLIKNFKVMQQTYFIT
jgi:hypothetical protein